MIDLANLEAFVNPDLPANDSGDSEGASAPDKFQILRPLLSAHVADIESCCDEIDISALRRPTSRLDGVDTKILVEGVIGLAPPLREALLIAVKSGLTLKEAREIADSMEAAGTIDDGERVAGWLYRVAQTHKPKR